MAILRERRQQALQRLYVQAALVYLLLSLIVTGISYLPGMMTPEQRAQMGSEVAVITVMYIAIATLVIWRSHRKLSFLLLLASLFQAVVRLMDGLGTRLAIEVETKVPETLTDPGSLQAFFQKETATSTPFFQTSPIADRDPIVLSEALQSARIPSGVLERLSGNSVPPAYLSLFSAFLLLVVALMLWRAVRRRP